MGDIVELILQIRNVAQFVSGANQAAHAAGDVGEQTEKAGKKASSGWKGLAKWAGGATAIYGATRYIKGAVSATEDLAKSTITVQRTTGMDTQTASEWSAVMKERGVSTKQFQTALVKLSKTMETSRTGTVKESATVAALRKQIDQVSAAGGKKAPAEIAKLSKAIVTAQTAGTKARQVLASLGASGADIAKGNTGAVLYKLADALKAMHDPAQRATTVQALFGRGGQALLPILMKGAAGVRQLLAQQKANGNYISGKGIKSAKDLIAQQRELNSALAGVKVQLGQQLLPVLLQGVKLLVAMLHVIQPLTKNATLFKIAIGLLAGAFVAYKAALVVSTIQQMELNAAMLANPVGLIIAGVAALVIGLVVLYKKWGWFHKAVDATWHWVKSHWPLLIAIILAPFGGLQVYAIIKNFGTIKKTVLDVFDTIKKALADVGQAFATGFHAMTTAATTAYSALAAGVVTVRNTAVGAFDAIKGAAVAVLDWVKGNWPYLVGALAGPLGLAAAAIYKNFDAIKAAASTAFGVIEAGASTVAQAFETAFSGVKQAVRGALNFLIRGWNSLQFKIPGVHVGPVHFGGVTLGVPQIPLLAQGGRITGAGAAIVGERGPELVTLPAGAGVHPLAAGAGPLEIVVPVMLDRREIARAVARVGSDQLARR